MCIISGTCRWDLCSYGIFHSVEWQFYTDVSGQPISPIFMGQVTLEYGADKLSQNVPTEYTLCCRIFQKIADLKELHYLVSLPFFLMTRPVKNNPQHTCVFLPCPLGQLQKYLYLVGSIFSSCHGCIHSCHMLEGLNFHTYSELKMKIPPISISPLQGC
jgi:hypothetical protein